MHYVVGPWSTKKVFIDDMVYSNKKPEAKVSSTTRSFLSWIANAFDHPDTSHSKVVDYKFYQVVEGYHEILREVFLTDKSKYCVRYI